MHQQEGASAAAAGVILEGEGGAVEDEDDTIVMVDNQGDQVDTSSMLQDATGEGHGKLVRNLLDIKNEVCTCTCCTCTFTCCTCKFTCTCV